MFESRIIYITLLNWKTGDDELASAFNQNIAEITSGGGKYIGAVLLSDEINKVGARFVRFLATFSDLNSNVGSRMTLASQE